MIVDSFLFFNEFSMLDVRLQYLEKNVDYFFIVESEYSFSGNKKGLSLRSYIRDKWPRLLDRIIIYENTTYLNDDNFYEILHSLPDGFKVHLNEFYTSLGNIPNRITWLNDFFQRECLCRVSEFFDSDSTIFISDIDEIVCSTLIEEIQSKEIRYYDMDYFKFWIFYSQNYNWRKVYSCRISFFQKFSVNELRNFDKVSEFTKVPVILIPKSGWHFTSFGTRDVFFEKLTNWGHQEYNTFIGRWLAKFRFDRGIDPFGSGDILKKTYVPIDFELERLLKESFDHGNFKKASFLDICLHRGAFFLELIYRKIFF